jgi:hypothetical protein
MRRSENEKGIFKKRYKKESQLLKRKENAIITVKKNISPKNIDYLKLIIQKPTISKRNENEKLKKSLSKKDLGKP